MDMQWSLTPGLRGALDALVDERFGVLASVVESPYERGEPPFFHFFAETAPTDRWLPRRPFVYGGGTSTRRDIALAKAVGECVERYCAAIYDLDALPLTSARNALFECIPPDRFALFSPQQYEFSHFPFRPFSAQTSVRWVAAQRITDGRTLHVPAASVFLPYYGERGDETMIIPPVSTGLAAGVDFAAASLSGILEVVERDAFCRCWYEMRSAPQICRESLPAALSDMLDRFEMCGYLVDLLDITSDLGVPVVLATARSGRRDGPALSVATSAALDPELAATKALEELAMTLRYQRDLKLGRYKTVDLAGDLHLMHWNERSRREDAAFLWASLDRVELAGLRIPGAPCQGPRALRWIADQLAQSSFDALVTDITSADIRPLGLVVVRAIVPGLQPLLFGDRMVARGGQRLRASTINPMPHPFP